MNVGGGEEGRAGLRWVVPLVGAAERATHEPCLWVLCFAFGCGAAEVATGSVGPIVVLGPADGSCFLSVGGFGHSLE